jgi:hypothetical protein
MRDQERTNSFLRVQCSALHYTAAAGTRLPPTLVMGRPGPIWCLYSVQCLPCTLYTVQSQHGAQARRDEGKREPGAGRCSAVQCTALHPAKKSWCAPDPS